MPLFSDKITRSEHNKTKASTMTATYPNIDSLIHKVRAQWELNNKKK
jgi:hypothetical protein